MGIGSRTGAEATPQHFRLAEKSVGQPRGSAMEWAFDARGRALDSGKEERCVPLR